MIALRRAAILIFLFTAILSLFFNASWDIWAQSLIHLLTLVILTLFLIQAAYKKNEITFSYTTADVWFVLYLAGIFLSYLYSVYQFNTRNELYNHLNYYIFLYLCPLLLAEDHWRDLFLKLLVIAVGLISLVILGQIWYGEQINGGPLLNANIASGLYVMAMPLVVSRLLLAVQQKKTITSYLPELVSAILILTGLLVNRSLGGWISLYFSMLLFLGLGRNISINTNNVRSTKKYVITGFLLSAIVIGSFVMAKMQEPEVYNRLLWWKGAVRMIKDHPLGGVGLGNFGTMYLAYKTAGLNSLYTHNHYLQLWSESGVFSLFFWLLGVYVIIRSNLAKLAGQVPQNKYIIIGLICAVSGLLFYNLIDYSLSIPAIAIIWWILLGMLRFSMPAKTHTFKIGAFSRVAYLFAVIILSIIVVKPFLASQRYVSGITYLRQNNLLEAKRIMNISIALDPLNAQAYGFLSDIAKKEGNLNTAVEYLQKAISLNKYFGPFHHNLALLYNDQDDLPQAIIEAEKALACHRQKALYHYTLSFFYKKAGRLPEAEQEYRQYQELLPHDQNN